MSSFYICNTCGQDFETPSTLTECPFCGSVSLVKEALGSSKEDGYYNESLCDELDFED